MKVVDFEGSNGNLDSASGNKIPIAFDQKNGMCTICWELGPEEIMEIFNSKKIYITTIVGNNKEMQPTLLTVKNPVSNGQTEKK